MGTTPSDGARPALTPVYFRLRSRDREQLQELAHDADVSFTAVVGAVLAQFLDDADGRLPVEIADRARAIDATRRRRDIPAS